MAAFIKTCSLNGLRIFASRSLKRRGFSENKTILKIGSNNLSDFCRTRCVSTSSFLAQSAENEKRTSLLEEMKLAEEKAKNDPEEEARKKARKEKFKKFQRWSLYFSGFAITGASLLAISDLGSPKKDADGNKIPDEYDKDFIVWAYLQRTFQEVKSFRTMIAEPSYEKLLPDPLTEPYYQPPYTLVLEMTNVLVNPEWTYANGWRFKKRPGVDYFFQQVAPPMFEIVIYTKEQGFTAFPLLESLDPNGYIMYRLFRDATKYVGGHHVKDLSKLNRDLSRVIFIDCDPKSYQLQPRNAIGLKKWEGDDLDRTLFHLSDLLRAIASSGVEDVRTVLDHYNQFDDPIQAFMENQARLQAERERQTQAKQDRGSNLAGSWSSRLLGR